MVRNISAYISRAVSSETRAAEMREWQDQAVSEWEEEEEDDTNGIADYWGVGGGGEECVEDNGDVEVEVEDDNGDVEVDVEDEDWPYHDALGEEQDYPKNWYEPAEDEYPEMW